VLVMWIRYTLRYTCMYIHLYWIFAIIHFVCLFLPDSSCHSVVTSSCWLALRMGRSGCMTFQPWTPPGYVCIHVGWVHLEMNCRWVL